MRRRRAEPNVQQACEDRREKLYREAGLNPITHGAQCVAIDMLDQGCTAEEAELYVRVCDWLDLRFPYGWGETKTVKGNGFYTEVLYYAIQPIYERKPISHATAL